MKGIETLKFSLMYWLVVLVGLSIIGFKGIYLISTLILGFGGSIVCFILENKKKGATA